MSVRSITFTEPVTGQELIDTVVIIAEDFWVKQIKDDSYEIGQSSLDGEMHIRVLPAEGTPYVKPQEHYRRVEVESHPWPVRIFAVIPRPEWQEANVLDFAKELARSLNGVLD